jgi:MATE family multidrug resistance protein
MLAHHSRLILAHATPMLLAQLSSMGMMIIDTALLGHYGTDDLAAVAVGGGIYISVVFALAGILQAIAPTVAHLHGAGRERRDRRCPAAGAVAGAAAGHPGRV